MPDNCVIAFDFGTQRIGVAVGQALTGSGTPLVPIKAKDGIPDWQVIEKLLQEWQPQRLLVGLPLNMDGSESDMSRRAKKFANRLHGRFGLAVTTVDERLSTFEAKQAVKQQGHKGNYREDPVDSIAAQILLEDWWRRSQ